MSPDITIWGQNHRLWRHIGLENLVEGQRQPGATIQGEDQTNKYPSLKSLPYSQPSATAPHDRTQLKARVHGRTLVNLSGHTALGRRGKWLWRGKKKKKDVWHNYWVTALFVKDSF